MPMTLVDGARGEIEASTMTSFSPNMRSVKPFFKSNDNTPDYKLNEYVEDAKKYICFYDWVKNVDRTFIGCFYEGIVCIVLFEIEPSRNDVDRWLWVIVGDLPAAYITCDVAEQPWEALDAYIGAMEKWVSAAKVGDSVAELIPVNVPATLNNARTLEKRLNFLDERILPELKARAV
jgi:hypothetical protein